MATVDVFVCNKPVVDFELFDYWLLGIPPQNVVTKISKSIIRTFEGVTSDLILGEVVEQYNMFKMLEHYLSQPSTFSQQLLFQIPPETFALLVNKYYALDEAVAREVLGKKLSTKNRKDLDDVSEETGISLRSCRRQFDNIRRIYRAVEDVGGPVVKLIETQFCLGPSLSKTYAAIAFMTDNRFETSKRLLRPVTLADFTYCSLDMMQNWSQQTFNPTTGDQLDLDRDFILGLKECRILLEREIYDDLKRHFMGQVQTAEKSTTDKMEFIFNKIGRPLITIGCNLNQSKEVRDYFLDLVEKVVLICKGNNVTHSELSSFSSHFADATAEVLSKKTQNSGLAGMFTRFINVTSNCTLRLYRLQISS